MRQNPVLLLVIICIVLLLWWMAFPPGGMPTPATHNPADASACPLPSTVARGDGPLQTEIPRGMSLPSSFQDARLTPLAGFSVDARVLSRENYYFDAGSEFSPTDLALGWGRMRDDAVLSQLSISQGERFFYYRWRDSPPIPASEIVRSASNMHIIPATSEAARALKQIKANDNIRIDGWLVRIDRNDGWHWTSSLTRDDSGDGACELIYACAITPR